MNPLRLALAGAVSVLAISLLYLAGWAFLWRLFVSNPLPAALYVMPLSALACGLLALGLILVVRRARGARAAGVATVVIAVTVLLEHLLGMSVGLEAWLFSEPAGVLLGGVAPGRPAPQSALVVLFLGAALWFLADDRKYRYDFADLGIGMALFLSLTILLGHVYQARALYYSSGGGIVGMSLVETLLLAVLAFAALCLNPAGVIATLAADDAAGATKRRVLPVVILVPVLLGLLQYASVKLQALEFSVALALAVAANVVVFIALAEWVGRTLARMEEERTGEFVEREIKARAEGMTDMLTGLTNRRGWDRAVAESETRCQREGLNACVIVVDLDGLKHINDTEGHARGDDFIRRAANALRGAARREDTLARLGGDEFACLSLNCPPENAQIVLKRLSQALQKASVPASLGYAMRDLAGSIATAFQEADRAMYQHKRARKGEGRKTVA